MSVRKPDTDLQYVYSENFSSMVLFSPSKSHLKGLCSVHGFLSSTRNADNILYNCFPNLPSIEYRDKGR